MYRIAFTSVTFRDLSLSAVADVAEEAEIKYLEWGGDVHLPPGKAQAITDIRDLQSAKGIQAISYGSYYTLGMRDYELWESIVKTAEDIGAKMIRIWMGNKSSRNTDEGTFQEMVIETRRLADAASQKGLTVTFEFHKNTYNDAGQSSVKFLNAVDRINIKTYWQPMGDKSDLNNLQKVMPYLAGIHVFSWRKNGMRLAFKRRKKQWTAFAQAVNEAKTKTNYIMEFVKKDSVGQFYKDVADLKQVLRGVYGNN